MNRAPTRQREIRRGGARQDGEVNSPPHKEKQPAGSQRYKKHGSEDPPLHEGTAKERSGFLAALRCARNDGVRIRRRIGGGWRGASWQWQGGGGRRFGAGGCLVPSFSRTHRWCPDSAQNRI